MSKELQEPLTTLQVKGRSWFMRTFGPISPSSMRTSIFALTSIGLGASTSHSGSLTFPMILQQSGVLLGLMIILAAGLISMTEMNAVSKGVQRTGEKTFTGMMKVAFGETARQISAWLIFLLMLAALCFYEVLSTL